MIIGAGVIGCAVARELSKYNANVMVVEKNEDVCAGTSKANSAIIHSGYDAKSGTLKAKFNVRGNEMMDALCRDLDIPFKRIGSLTICTDEADIPALEELKARGGAAYRRRRRRGVTCTDGGYHLPVQADDRACGKRL